MGRISDRRKKSNFTTTAAGKLNSLTIITRSGTKDDDDRDIDARLEATPEAKRKRKRELQESIDDTFLDVEIAKLEKRMRD